LFNKTPKSINSINSFAQILALILGSTPNASGLEILGFEKLIAVAWRLKETVE
jgi:hypothetical protein